ncbi:hypothetical protein EDD16DRAFT_1495134 [Pisolithus croceorrhizus]|nr:hypothetical protein EDD16DRAFT_1495134 [Pisolithus croceorrhizus]
MFQSFLKGAKLRGWMSRSDCPPIIHECKVLLDRAYSTLDKIDNDVILRARLKHVPGVYYCRSSTHIGNSLILFYSQGNWSLSPVPGSIKYIYESEGSWHFAVQRQRSLATIGTDPYAAYPHFPAKLYSSALEEKLESVRVSWVISHFAQWAVSHEHVVVLSLCKVSGYDVISLDDCLELSSSQ